MHEHANATGLMTTVTVADKLANPFMQPTNTPGNLVALDEFRQSVKRNQIGRAHPIDHHQPDNLAMDTFLHDNIVGQQLP
jgi:hypothetical protein